MKLLSSILNSINLVPKKEEYEDLPKENLVHPFIKQSIVALGPLILTICSGMTFGYSAILIPQLQTINNSTLVIDKEEESWIASIASLPMTFGSVFGGIFTEQYGRKSAHLFSCFPTFIGWLLIYLATDTKMILIGRFITGFFTGMLASTTGIYIGETSDPEFRGILLAAISTSISLGLFVSHILGTFITWRNTALICSLFPLIGLIILLFVPESPSWLAMKGKIKKAENSFYWCRGTTESSTKELAIMLQKQDQSNKENKKIYEKFIELFVPEFLKPLGIIIVFITANQWAGINAITFYAVGILKDTIGDGFNEYLAMLIIDFIRLIMSTIACILLRKIGRRPLGIISGIGTFLPLFMLCLYIYLIKFYPVLKFTYIPVILLIIYVIFITIGFIPLPWALLGEIFPLKHRSIGSGISSFIAFLSSFTVVKTAPSMFENYGSDGTFLTYGIVAFIGTLFIYFYLPETKGKTLNEIEEGFKK